MFYVLTVTSFKAAIPALRIPEEFGYTNTYICRSKQYAERLMRSIQDVHAGSESWIRVEYKLEEQNFEDDFEDN